MTKNKTSNAKKDHHGPWFRLDAGQGSCYLVQPFCSEQDSEAGVYISRVSAAEVRDGAADNCPLLWAAEQGGKHLAFLHYEELASDAAAWLSGCIADYYDGEVFRLRDAIEDALRAVAPGHIAEWIAPSRKNDSDDER